MSMFEGLAQYISNMELQMLLRLLLATVLGGVVGIERGKGDRPAGLRTHVLVCVGSTLFMLVSIFGFGDTTPVHTTVDDLGVRRDSARIAAQVVSGIGFLGAGTIIHEGLSIKGLTTAASMWMVSAIGLAVGAGMYVVSIGSTLLTLVVLTVLHKWEKHIGLRGKTSTRFIVARVENRVGIVTDVMNYLTLNAVKLKSLNVKSNDNNQTLELEMFVKYNPEVDNMEVISGLHEIDGFISLENVK